MVRIEDSPARSLPGHGRETLSRAFQRVETPAFVYDEGEIDRLLEYADRLRDGGCAVLYSTKAFPFGEALKLMAPRLDGFAVSSAFEARLARESAGPGQTLHITTPGIRPDEASEIAALCDFVSFNSLTQWETYGQSMSLEASCGLRVNPQLSFLDDDRYDPCGTHSKLGAAIDRVALLAEREPARLSGLDGIHVHSNCDSTDFRQLRATVELICTRLDRLLGGLTWINLGGGYLFESSIGVDAIIESSEALRSRYGLRVFVEPGAAFVRSAGYLVSGVLDLFESDGKTVAVLDTSVNHMPEVFEYGFQPDAIGGDEDGPHEYVLAGSTCLAGDRFGIYRFDSPLQVGSRVAFKDAGAYTLSKAQTFNGVNLPAIYALTAEGGLVLKKRSTYAEYAERWGPA